MGYTCNYRILDMSLYRTRDTETIVQAINYLSSIAEMPLLTDQDTKQRSSEKRSQEEKIRSVFQTLFQYIQGLYEKDRDFLEKEEIRNGIQSLILLAEETAERLDTHLSKLGFFKEIGGVRQIEEYRSLIKFYHDKIFPKIRSFLDSKAGWKNWDVEANEETLSIQKPGLLQLNNVRNDREYELFLIRREDGSPYFTRTLLRHLQFVCQIEALLIDSSSEGLLFQADVLKEFYFQHMAQKMLVLTRQEVEAYFKLAMKYKQLKLVASVNKALIALFLASIENKSSEKIKGKNAFHYYADFQFYLRQAIYSEEYQRYLSHPLKSAETWLQTLLAVIDALCFHLFTKRGFQSSFNRFLDPILGVKKENSSHKKKENDSSFFKQLVQQDATLRNQLNANPNGPIKKAFDLFQEEGQLSGFDPMSMGNVPCQLYAIVKEDVHISCLHLPAPILQKFIRKAEVLEEFHLFLRHLAHRNKHHLLINLQDRTSWQEHARCVALEELPDQLGLSNALSVITFAKSGDFYQQQGPYEHLNCAKDFIKQLKEQVLSGESCGFYFPKSLKKEELIPFLDRSLQKIHTLFFSGKELLTHQNRLAFIEIFYLLFTLKLIEMLTPDTISFTSKDGMDAGALHHCEMFAFLKIINDGSPWSKEEKNLLDWMLYAPSLMQRLRAIDKKGFERMVGALEVIQAGVKTHPKQVKEGLNQLFESLKSLKIDLSIKG